MDSSTSSSVTSSSSTTQNSASSANSANNSASENTLSSSPARSFNYNYSGGGSSYSSGSYSSGSYGNDGYRSSAAPGLCGLSNLGNTCFMNSALQCMSNVPELTEHFLEEKWKDELNYDNPLGMHGEIATSYAELVRNMWSGRYSYTVPRNFKVSVGRFAPQFSGYQQQDSQELMAFLLDGLHEDLNRIRKKPYVELKDADGRPDQEVANEAWENYKKRNDSVITDIFHGLLKSTLVCPDCKKVSVTFDPFCYLSLPLPIRKERQIEVFLIPQDSMKKPRHFKLTVPKMGNVDDLCNALSKLTDIQPDKMVVTDVYNHRFHKVFTRDEALSHILDRDDIFVYEVPVSTAEDPDTVILPIYQREKRAKQGGYNNYGGSNTALFGQPLLVPVPRKNCTYDVLYNCVLDRMARYVQPPADNNEWWKKSSDKKSVNNDEQHNGVTEMEEDEECNTTQPGSSTNGDADSEDEAIEVDSSDPPRKKKPRLFTFHMVNSYGSSEVDGIRDDGKAIKFSNRSYVAIDWNLRGKELFFDEKSAEEFEEDDSIHQRPLQKKQTIQLNECLELFTTTEKLGEQDPWYCPHCKKHQQATKKFDLWKMPEYLVVHLKRFSYNRYWRDKLDVFVEYPTRGLNLKKYVIDAAHGPAVYDLVAVSNHYGGMGGGHYTAYAKNKDDDQWYHFDDSSVSQSTEDSVVTKAGYVLVYQRRRANQKGVHSPPSATVTSSSEGMSVNNGEASSTEDDMDLDAQ